jgi:hypothetical protein
LENNKTKYFNKNSSLWDKKIFLIIKIGYIICIIACITGDVLYYYDFYSNDEILIYLLLFPIFMYMAFDILKKLLIKPNGDREYLLTYYPDLIKKLFWPKWWNPIYGCSYINIKKFLGWKYFIDGSYLKDIDDKIIDEMRLRFKEHRNLVLYLIIFFILFSILLGMCIELK